MATLRNGRCGQRPQKNGAKIQKDWGTGGPHSPYVRYNRETRFKREENICLRQAQELQRQKDMALEIEYEPTTAATATTAATITAQPYEAPGLAVKFAKDGKLYFASYPTR